MDCQHIPMARARMGPLRRGPQCRMSIFKKCQCRMSLSLISPDITCRIEEKAIIIAAMSYVTIVFTPPPSHVTIA